MITKIIDTIEKTEQFETIDFADVLTNTFTNQKGLFATKFFNKDELLCTFSSETIVDEPTYLTVQIDEHKHITLKPSILQFTNHSCEPNVFFDTNTFHFKAVKNINIGDELTFFYPSTEWNMAQGFACTCGSNNCLKEIKGAKYLNKTVVEKYKLTDFILKMLNS